MELFQLEAFLAVVREGSFSAAAKALFRTQPAISQTIVLKSITVSISTQAR